MPEKNDQGFTLIEVIIAVVLSFVVLLSASNLFINFGRFSANFIRAESSLMGSTVGVFEEIVQNINAANQVTITSPGGSPVNSRADIRVDRAFTPTDFSDDITYTFRQIGNAASGNQIGYSTTNPARAEYVVANDIVQLRFDQDPLGEGNNNKIRVTLNAQAASGPVAGQSSREVLQTIAVMRSRSANLS